MKLILSPQACPVDDTPPTVQGEVLTYRGASYDLSPIQEGDIYEHGEPFLGGVTRTNGELVATLIYSYNWDTSEDHQPASLDAYTFTVTDGQCPCPIIRRPLPQPESEELLIIQLLQDLKEQGWTDEQLAALTPEQIHSMLYPAQPEGPSNV